MTALTDLLCDGRETNAWHKTLLLPYLARTISKEKKKEKILMLNLGFQR